MPADLISTALVTAAYTSPATGATDLSTAQQALLPRLVSTASESIRRWTGRDFVRAVYDELYAPGRDGMVLLRQYPVNGVLRVAGGRTAALRVQNTDAATNQRATVGFATTGDVAAGLVVTGLVLARVAAGVTTVAPTLAFTTYPTLAALAAAIGAVGSGWTGQALGSLGPWPSAELVGGDVAQGALGGCTLDVFAVDLAGGQLDRASGRLRLRSGTGTGTGAGGLGFVPEYGWPGDPFFDDQDDGPIAGSPVRVQYDAGYDVVPGPIVDACIQAVKALLDIAGIDQAVSSETIDQEQDDYNLQALCLTPAVKGLCAPYRDYRP